MNDSGNATCPLCGDEDVRAHGEAVGAATRYSCRTCRQFVIDHAAEHRLRPTVGGAFNRHLSRRAAETWVPDAADDAKRILYVFHRDGVVSGRRIRLDDPPLP